MIKGIKFLLSQRSAVLLLGVSFFFLQCAEEEFIVPDKPQESAAEIAAPSAEILVPSFTISGIHTTMVEEVECSTCTYVVPANVSVVDGAESNIKPGNVICLDKTREYGMLELINLVGTEEKPIIIGYCNE